MGLRPRLIDSHAHFDDASFDSDRAEALARAEHVGVEAQIIPAVKAAWWPRIRQLSQTYTGLHATYGLHPMYLEDHRTEHLDQLHEWVEREQPVAIGECGLDFYIDDPQPETQQFYFERQLDLARQSNLPVIIHARRSVEAVINTLRNYPGMTGVLHSYAGSEQQARQLIDMGFCVSFGGPVTYERSKRLHKLVQNLPLSSILLETDAPDQPGSAHRGERNEPAYLPEVLKAVSRLRDQDPAEIAEQTSINTRRLFHLD
ncbi:MAG: TatD family hydrolase [Candidatus Thiodiazotropha sp. (ex Monitilora ramsayi)]|nr:TatD family hydrolase [Candidatus Thiodiazotropha sp. (ex Monitilora ramsayi)]